MNRVNKQNTQTSIKAPTLDVRSDTLHRNETQIEIKRPQTHTGNTKANSEGKGIGARSNTVNREDNHPERKRQQTSITEKRLGTPIVGKGHSAYRTAVHSPDISNVTTKEKADESAETNSQEGRDTTRLALSTPKMKTDINTDGPTRQATTSVNDAVRNAGRLSRQQTPAVTNQVSPEGRLSRQKSTAVKDQLPANGGLTRLSDSSVNDQITDNVIEASQEIDKTSRVEHKDKLTLTTLNLLAEKRSLSLEEDPTPKEYRCILCNMTFNTKPQLTYHKSELCIGEILIRDDILSTLQLRTPRQDSPIVGGFHTHSVVPREHTQYDGQTFPKLHWDMCFNGIVPDFAVKAGFDYTAKCEIYVGRARVQNGMVPGKVVPYQKCAYVTVKGQVHKVTEYEVLTDPHNILTWKHCDVIGGIPRGAQKGGYDSDNLIYFIARATAPDGCPCSGKYVPHELKCYFAWGGEEHVASKFEFLCKK